MDPCGPRGMQQADRQTNVVPPQISSPTMAEHPESSVSQRKGGPEGMRLYIQPHKAQLIEHLALYSICSQKRYETQVSGSCAKSELSEKGCHSRTGCCKDPGHDPLGDE